MGRLSVLQRAPPVPVPALVRKLRELLEQAEAGELRGMVLVAEHEGLIERDTLGEFDSLQAIRGWLLDLDSDLAELVCEMQEGGGDAG